MTTELIPASEATDRINALCEWGQGKANEL